MRLLADENFPGLAVEALRSRGHDVVWVREVAPGSSDPAILAWAQEESRIIITFDKDFGELAYRWQATAQSGIVLFRIPMPSARYVAEMAVAALESREDWTGHFAVVEEKRIRILPLA